jgi:epoxyqueuosine reductase
MAFLARNPEGRYDARSLLQECQSVVVVALSYAQEEDSAQPASKIARYAWGDDYHDVVEGKLLRLAGWLAERVPGLCWKATVDNSPLAEKTLAVAAGIGWQGKNTLVISERQGSYFFLGCLLLSIELPVDTSVADGCGDCRLCLDACPTGALAEPGVLDASRCISYQNTNRKGGPAQGSRLAGWLFGCDECQLACPYNAELRTATEQRFALHAGIKALTAQRLLCMSEDELLRSLDGTALIQHQHDALRVMDMSGFLTMIVILGAVLLAASYARKMQQGGFTEAEQRALWQRGVVGGVLLVIVIIIASSIVVVPVGDNMVVYNLVTSRFSKPLQPGYHLVLPVINERVMYDMRTQVYTMSGITQEGDVLRADAIEVLSSDGLKMDLDITVQYRIDDTQLNEMHSGIGPKYVDKIIRPTVREAIRNEFALHEATAAYSSKREEIERSLEQRMEAALSKYFLVLQEIQIRNIQLPPTVVAAIEEKKAAQQEAERMQYILEKELQEKERVIIEAEAQAERIRIVNEALASNPNYLNWLAIDKLNDNIELVISDGKTILNLDAMRAD